MRCTRNALTRKRRNSCSLACSSSSYLMPHICMREQHTVLEPTGRNLVPSSAWPSSSAASRLPISAHRFCKRLPKTRGSPPIHRGGHRSKAVRSEYFLKKEKPSVTAFRSEEHTSELQSHLNLVCRLLLEKKKQQPTHPIDDILQTMTTD